MEIRKYFEVNKIENTTYQTSWDAAKTVFTGKLIPVYAYIKKEERSQINNIILHIKALWKKKSKQNLKLAEERN